MEVSKLAGEKYGGSMTGFDSNIKFHLLKQSSGKVSASIPRTYIILKAYFHIVFSILNNMGSVHYFLTMFLLK